MPRTRCLVPFHRRRATRVGTVRSASAFTSRANAVRVASISPLLDGPTVVVSPLLSLQQDQLAGLAERDHADLSGAAVNSAASPGQRRAAVQAASEGRLEYLFLTPEQLADPDRLETLRRARPSLVAVDEAHCVSAWGFDFRPDYLQLGRAIEELGRPPVVALTATASPPVREDIVRWLRLHDSAMPGIVYTPTRRRAEDLAEESTADGFAAAPYHGGMPVARRRQLHEDFLSGRVPVMVATNAFGMGIDKPDVRWVIHAGLPDSPDSYLQEIGRAGRDGAAGWAPYSACCNRSAPRSR
jgi:ATP-dependent DNA helicase RecQ